MSDFEPTFVHEENLPKLPLPDINDTLDHLKKSLEPLYYADGYHKHPLYPQQISHLHDILNDFKESKVATVLQKKLKQFHMENDSYLDNLHLDINNHIGTKNIQNDILPRNPFLILADDAIPDIIQVERASVLVHSALRFISALKTHFLPNDINSKTGVYLSMFPYLNLFGTTRYPVFQNGEIEKFNLNKLSTISDLNQNTSEECLSELSDNENDEFISHGITINRYSDSKHILIISKGQYYILDVLDENNDIICTSTDLSKFFEFIIKDSEKIDSNLHRESTALGSLTSHSYKNWKYSRKRLLKRYPKELYLIDSALFVLVLDDSQQHVKKHYNNIYTQNVNYFPEFDQESSTNCKRLLYGTSIIDHRGYQVGTCVSRWFDKLQIVVTRDSKAAVIWDSFTCDGSVVLRFASEMYTESILRLAREVNANDPRFSLWPKVSQSKMDLYKGYSKRAPETLISKIYWSFNNILNTHVHLSETKLADLISKYDIVRVSIPLGRKSAQMLGIKPDSMVQIALQIAHYALYGQMVFTLEPISTRNFKNSRSSFINIQNQDVLELCQSFISSTIDGPEKLDKFIQTCEKHYESIKAAKNGKCYEKHFNALKSLYKFHNHFDLNLADTDIEIANNLFDSSLIAPFSQPELIATNCGNAATTTFGITPAIPQGFGIGYIIKDDQIDLTVTSQFRQGKRLMFMLNWVLQEVKSFWKDTCHTSRNKTGVKISPLIDKLYELDNAINKEAHNNDPVQNDKKNVGDIEGSEKVILSPPDFKREETNQIPLKSKNSHIFNYGFFDIDGHSRNVSVTQTKRETSENNIHTLSSRLTELAMSNNSIFNHQSKYYNNNFLHHSSSALSIPTESEKLNTGHEIVQVQPNSLSGTKINNDSEVSSPSSQSSYSRPETSRSRRHCTNVINSKFEIDFDRSHVGKKVFVFE